MLREADFHIPPIIPDHTSIYALEVLGHFKGLNPEMGFAENLGVLINMNKMQSSVDAEHQRRLMANTDNRCFDQAIPRTRTLQHVSQFSPVERSYGTKYPGESGNAYRICASSSSTGLKPPMQRAPRWRHRLRRQRRCRGNLRMTVFFEEFQLLGSLQLVSDDNGGVGRSWHIVFPQLIGISAYTVRQLVGE